MTGSSSITIGDFLGTPRERDRALLTDVLAGSGAVEPTYLAALGHDSVHDVEAPGHPEPAPCALEHTSVVLLMGDFLFARASQILAVFWPRLRTRAG